MLWVYYMTGVRVNEGTALHWHDINLEKKSMRVHHMLVIKNRQDWKRNSYTKTEDGKRRIAIDDDTVKVLTECRTKQIEYGLGNDNDFVFSYDGLPMIKSTISRIINRYAKFAGVKKFKQKG